MDVKSELRRQIIAALSDVAFPIRSPQELLASFPQGADTTCEAGDVKLRAGDAGGVLTEDDSPFTDAAQVADTILSRAL